MRCCDSIFKCLSCMLERLVEPWGSSCWFFVHFFGFFKNRRVNKNPGKFAGFTWCLRRKVFPFLSFWDDTAYFLGGKWFVFGTRMNLSFWSLFAPCFLKSKMRGNSASKVKGISQHHESEDSCGHCCRGQMSNNVYDAVSKFKPFDKEHRFRQLSVEPAFPCAPLSMENVIHFCNFKTESQERTLRKNVQEGHDIYHIWHGQCFQPPSILQDCDGKN